LKEGHKIVRIYSDSWCLCNGIAIWSPKWQQSDWKINGKDIWSREDWMAIAEASKHIKIYVTHVDACTSKTDPSHAHSDKADKLAALMTSKLTISSKSP
jgi:hypothetical protein